MVAWKKNWDFDIPSIDNQHKNIIKAINALEEYLGENRIRLDIQKLILALTKYATIHFKYEEKLLKKAGYPDLNKHIDEHTDFLEELLIFETKMKMMNGSKETISGYIDFLNNWLIYHIQGSDRKYVDLLKDQNIQ